MTIDRVDKKTNWCHNNLYSSYNWWHFAGIWRTLIARVGAFFTSVPIETLTEDQQLQPQQSQNTAEM
jgi:hypothetical protein